MRRGVDGWYNSIKVGKGQGKVRQGGWGGIIFIIYFKIYYEYEIRVYILRKYYSVKRLFKVIGGVWVRGFKLDRFKEIWVLNLVWVELVGFMLMDRFGVGEVSWGWNFSYSRVVFFRGFLVSI